MSAISLVGRHQAWAVTMGRILVAVGLMTALIVLSVTGQPAGLRKFGGGYVPPPINGVTFGTPYRYNLGYSAKYLGGGDGLNSTWADDNKIYSFLNDTWGGWQGLDGSSNMAISSWSGYTASLTGSKVNTMTAFGTETQYGGDNISGSAPNGGTSKLGGIMSVSGVLYALYYRGETCINGTIIKSIDHGVSWVPQPPGGSIGVYNTGTTVPFYMFQGGTFPLAWVMYSGKDYPSDLVDNSATYVYAAFNDCGGSTYPHHEWLGRVKITDLPLLDATKWSYFKGGDGLQDVNWDPSIANAQVILTLPTTPYNSRSLKSLHYLPHYQQYLAIAYTNTGTTTTPRANAWTLYTAPHPWGPYTQINCNVPSAYGTSGTYCLWGNSTNPTALYTPSIIAQSLSVDGGATFYVSAAGDYTGDNSPGNAANTYYCLWITSATVN